MRKSLLAAVIALALLSWPASGQEAGNHVLMDMTVSIPPGDTVGHCVLLDAGTLDVTVQSVDDRAGGPVTQPVFSMGPYRTSPPGPGSPPEIDGVTVTVARTTTTLPVQGRLYCYNLRTEANQEIALLPSRERLAYFRFVSVKMVLTPQ